MCTRTIGTGLRALQRTGGAGDKSSSQTRDQFLERHLLRDFGERPFPEDREDLEEHLADRRPIVSYFKVEDDRTLWIVTEAGWHVTRLFVE